ncbi:dynein axonemal intermediate chain 3-like isoform X2 [Diachasmimorpha longicaudata]|uniref:dynein axonemal intermediate chain 3-like isoform X2 n=1 Tax=Diachasmimorpha longicaudata TaxID=58733 RepID=UPI0030B877A4
MECDFLRIRDEIFQYPNDTILIGLAPNRANNPEFYICLTKASCDTVVNKIEASRNDQESFVKNAVIREPGHWYDLGSHKNIDESTIVNTRPLFESEIVVKGEFFKAPITLVDRNADDQRDSYVELVTLRQSFNNVITRRLVSRGDDTNPYIYDNNTQTSSQKPLNSWFQYSTYDYKPINTVAYIEDETRALQKLLRTRTHDICDKVLMNTAWDIYTDECRKLVKNDRDIQIPVPVVYEEYQNYHNIEITKDKVINDLCWHPLWTGIAVTAYKDHSKSENLTGKYLPTSHSSTTCLGDNCILIWSFNDCLKPKLVLQCFPEVTTISIRPLDGTIVIGGCGNGQMAIWQISGEIENVETITAVTPTQTKSKVVLKNLMEWMKEPIGYTKIHPTAMSSIQSSQKAPITQIIWLPTYTRIGQNGRFVQLEDADSASKEIGWQFVTSSEDGTVAFWDLRIQENIDITEQIKKKKTSPNYTAEKLKQSISPLKALDDVLTPIYMLMVKHPEEERRVTITTMSIYVPREEKMQIEPFSKSTDIAIRKYYKYITTKRNHEMVKMIFIGTLEGDVGTITWDGFEFANSLTMNRESVSWIWRNTMIHDGPVTHSVRSKYLNDVIMTVGGKTFAVWREDFSEPVFIKRSSVRYTACSWGTSRPTVVLLGRADGTIEIWDLIVKSHEACFTQNLSGRMITGIYTHELYLNPQCVVFCDYNGAMRVFLAPASLLLFEETQIKWMRSFVDREVDRIREFHEWQSSWNEKNYESTEEQGQKGEEKKEILKRTAEREEKDQAEIAEMAEKIGLTQLKRKPGQFIEEAKNRWKLMELKRMQQIILQKKGLRADDIDRKQAPVLKLRKETKLKKKRVDETLRQKNKIFEETLIFLFPERHDKRVNYSTAIQDSEIPAAYGSPASGETEREEMEALMNRVKAEQTPEDREAILKEHKKICGEALKHLEEHPFKDFFNWQKVMSEGEHRRHSLDVQLRNTLKKRSKAPKVM